MTANNKYEDIHWVSLETVRQHLFTRLKTPLQKAIELARQAPARAVCQLQRAQNTLDAWSALIRWKHDPASIADEFISLDMRQLPEWVRKDIQRFASLSQEQTRTLYVHPAAFFEAILLLVQIARSCGKISQIMVNDASSPRGGVWFRVVFVPENDYQFQSKLSIMDTLTERIGEEVPLQFALIADLLNIHHTRFSLQNNTRTGHQAFAIAIDHKETPVAKPEKATPPKAASSEAAPAKSKTAPESKDAATQPERPTAPVTVKASLDKVEAKPEPAAQKPAPQSESKPVPDDTKENQEEKPKTQATATEPAAPKADGDKEEKFVEPMKGDEPTNPLPAVSLVEKAEEIDETDDVLAQVQDILLDYIGTTTLLSRASEIVTKIYALLKAEHQSVNGNNTVLDQPKLQQLYTILKASPEQLKQDNLTDVDTKAAQDILTAVQGLLLEPVAAPAKNDHKAEATATTEHEPTEQPEPSVVQLEATADEPAQDPSVSQNAEPSSK